MLASILSSLLTTQIATAQKQVVWVVAGSQDQLELPKYSNPEQTSAELESAYGLVAKRFEFENTVVFVSEKAFPFESYKMTSAWFKENLSADKIFFDPNTMAGKQLLDFIQTRSFVKSFVAEPGSEPVGLSVGLKLNDPNMPKSVPYLRQLADTRDVKPALVTPLNGGMEEVKRIALENTKKPTLFPTNDSNSKVTIIGYRSGKLSPISSRDSLAVKTLLVKLTEDLIVLEEEYKNSLVNAINLLGNKLMPGFPGASLNSLNYNDLPQEERRLFEYSFLANWEDSGFSSREEAESYLASNPSLNVEFSLVAFEVHTYPGQDGSIKSGYAQFIKP